MVAVMSSVGLVTSLTLQLACHLRGSSPSVLCVGELCVPAPSLCFHPLHSSRPVPAVLLASCDVPVGLAVRGTGALIQTTAIRTKKKLKGDDNAQSVGQVTMTTG